MILSLLWKEYRDYRWPVFLCTPLICVLDHVCRTSTGSGEAETLVLLLQTIIFAVFIASNVIAGESARGTQLTLYALPVHRPLLWAIKVLAGLVALLIPMLVLLSLSTYERVAEYPIMNEYRPTAMSLLTSALGIYAWTLFFAASCRSRGSVLIFGVLVVVMSYLCMIGFIDIQSGRSTLADRTLASFAPGFALIRAGEFQAFQHLALTRTAALLLILLLGWIKLFRKAPIEEQSGLLSARRPARVAQFSTRVRARNFPFPTIWKAYREIRNLALGAIATNAFFALAMVAFMFGVKGSSGLKSDWNEIILPGLTVASSFFWVASGSILAIAMGIRITGNIFRPKAADFWRSRPLHPLLYVESQAIAGTVAIGMGCLLFGIIAWTITKNSRDGLDIVLATKLSFFIQILMFPVTLFIGSIARGALLTASIASAVLIVVFLSALSYTNNIDRFAMMATFASLFTFLITTLLWQKRLGDSALRTFKIA